MKNQQFNSVWDAIESTPINAASMQARSKLMMEISSVIEKNEMTQTEAAQLFGVTQPRISDLMRGKINLFSLDTLMNMAATAGMAPEVKLSRPKMRVGWVNWGQINIVLISPSMINCNIRQIRSFYAEFTSALGWKWFACYVRHTVLKPNHRISHEWMFV